ncbi:hypothetical protein KSC_110820 [Ktedonobacter sp. SOSP1-52]|nr:hypothetical protein [Ktedonobacter sp. SOSP1-52]GHO72190.1 hypothetical protein KSC_110820 [Ktedonobacter sp. SOSP1-52]
MQHDSLFKWRHFQADIILLRKDLIVFEKPFELDRLLRLVQELLA